MSVKADIKGRLTGATPGETYVKTTHPDGTITFTPSTPRDYDNVFDITESEFEKFFQVSAQNFARDGLTTVHISEEGFLPSAIFFRNFLSDEDGNRIRTGEGTEIVTETNIIRIRKTPAPPKANWRFGL